MKKLLKLLKDEVVIQYGEFNLTSGIKASYYCDMKLAFGNPRILKVLVKELSPLVPKRTTCVAGLGYGGITLATLISYKLDLPLILVRDKAREHGTKKMIDGYVPSKKD